MKFLFLGAFGLLFQNGLQAQFQSFSGPMPQPQYQYDYGQHAFGFGARKKLLQRNHGVIVGLQRGRSTAIELGGEAHWRKFSLKDPHIIGATANMEYDFGQHMVGYKAGAWMKRGRINFTYGANVGYYTDFKGRNIYTAGPAIGFRLLGLHLVNGYNFQAGDTKGEKGEGGVNTLYMSLRYYFPMQNKFVWDKPTQKQKERAKAKKKKQREKERSRKQKEREAGDGKKILGIQF